MTASVLTFQIPKTAVTCHCTMGGDKHKSKHSKRDHKKKKHRSHDRDDSLADSSGNEDNAEPMWVEKEIDPPAVTLGASVAAREVIL